MNKTGVILLFLLVFLFGCTEERRHQAPYEEYFQVGFFGHGEGIFGELGLNLWGITRRCDSCHAVSSEIHPNLGSCNSCHQPHLSGWKKSKIAIYHSQVYALEQTIHFELDCVDCHQALNSREEYKKTGCIQCHNHTVNDIKLAHKLMMTEFIIEKEYYDHRCISCHVKTGKDYHKFYDPATNQLL